MALRLVVDNDRRPDLRRPASPYAPIVHGVAQGLNAAFPPINQPDFREDEQAPEGTRDAAQGPTDQV